MTPRTLSTGAGRPLGQALVDPAVLAAGDDLLEEPAEESLDDDVVDEESPEDDVLEEESPEDEVPDVAEPSADDVVRLSVR